MGNLPRSMYNCAGSKWQDTDFYESQVQWASAWMAWAVKISNDHRETWQPYVTRLSSLNPGPDFVSFMHSTHKDIVDNYYPAPPNTKGMFVQKELDAMSPLQWFVGMFIELPLLQDEDWEFEWDEDFSEHIRTLCRYSEIGVPLAFLSSLLFRSLVEVITWGSVPEPAVDILQVVLAGIHENSSKPMLALTVKAGDQAMEDTLEANKVEWTRTIELFQAELRELSTDFVTELARNPKGVVQPLVSSSDRELSEIWEDREHGPLPDPAPSLPWFADIFLDSARRQLAFASLGVYYDYEDGDFIGDASELTGMSVTELGAMFFELTPESMAYSRMEVVNCYEIDGYKHALSMVSKHPAFGRGSMFAQYAQRLGVALDRVLQSPLAPVQLTPWPAKFYAMVRKFLTETASFSVGSAKKKNKGFGAQAHQKPPKYKDMYKTEAKSIATSKKRQDLAYAMKKHARQAKRTGAGAGWAGGAGAGWGGGGWGGAGWGGGGPGAGAGAGSSSGAGKAGKAGKASAFGDLFLFKARLPEQATRDVFRGHDMAAALGSSDDEDEDEDEADEFDEDEDEDEDEGTFSEDDGEGAGAYEAKEDALDTIRVQHHVFGTLPIISGLEEATLQVLQALETGRGLQIKPRPPMPPMLPPPAASPAFQAIGLLASGPAKPAGDADLPQLNVTVSVFPEVPLPAAIIDGDSPLSQSFFTHSPLIPRLVETQYKLDSLLATEVRLATPGKIMRTGLDSVFAMAPSHFLHAWSVISNTVVRLVQLSTAMDPTSFGKDNNGIRVQMLEQVIRLLYAAAINCGVHLFSSQVSAQPAPQFPVQLTSTPGVASLPLDTSSRSDLFTDTTLSTAKVLVPRKWRMVPREGATVVDCRSPVFCKIATDVLKSLSAEVLTALPIPAEVRAVVDLPMYLSTPFPELTTHHISTNPGWFFETVVTALNNALAVDGHDPCAIPLFLAMHIAFQPQ